MYFRPLFLWSKSPLSQREGLASNKREEKSAAHHVDRPLAALGVTGGQRIWDILTGLC